MALPTTLLLLILIADGLSPFFIPATYTLRFDYTQASTTPDPRAGLERFVRETWPAAEPAWQDNERCGPDSASLEVQVRGNFLQADRIFNGPLSGHARSLGLVPCGAGLGFSRPSNLIWGPVGGFSLAAVVLVGLMAIRRWRPQLASAAFGWSARATGWRALAIGLFAGLSTWLVCALWAAAWRVTGLESGLGPIPGLDVPITRQDVLATLLPALVFSPLVEEYLFRALLLERMTRVIGAVPALLWSSMIFVGIHVPATVETAVGLLLASIGFSLVWLRTRSLLACVAAHAVFNLLASLALLSQLPG